MQSVLGNWSETARNSFAQCQLTCVRVSAADALHLREGVENNGLVSAHRSEYVTTGMDAQPSRGTRVLCD
jgi:hypothetical protein